MTYLCPARVDWHAPDSMSQILMVLSREPLARMLGFWGSNATQRTQLLLTNTKLELNYHRRRSFQRDGTYLCPVRVDWHAPDSMFQILMVLSSEQLARMLGFWGSKATQRTQPLLANTKLEYPVRSIASPLAQQRPISDCLVPHRGFFNELSLEAVTFKLFLDLIRRAAKRACFDVNIDASRETSSPEGSLKLRQI